MTTDPPHDDPSPDAPPADPTTEAWEAWAREQLEDVDADTDLGVDMARDAQRVVAGELDEEAFLERYHDAILAEFGEDRRELGVALDDPDVGDGRLGDRLSGLLEDEDSRREFLKKGGLAAVGLAMAYSGAGAVLGAADQPATDPDDGDEGTRWGMVINLDNCDGCLECMVACKGLHGTSRGAHWIYVMQYADPAQEEDKFFVRTCMHCGNAPCEKVCPVGARHTRKKDGLVLTDYDICIGCRYCMVSCPYGANYFQWGDPDTPRQNEAFTHDDRGVWVDGPPPIGAMGKCTFEPAWQDGREGEKLVGTTMCEMACTRDAIHFGDLNDPDSDPNRHLREYVDDHPNDQSEFSDRADDTVSTFRALEDKGTDPGVIFIGNEPSPHAEQVEGPVRYEDVGLVDHRKATVLDGGDDG
ncbi:MAG: 4Fe-4S ferredoxin N-terminal domain-containing protein [Halobacteriales archaeon]